MLECSRSSVVALMSHQSSEMSAVLIQTVVLFAREARA